MKSIEISFQPIDSLARLNISLRLVFSLFTVRSLAVIATRLPFPTPARAGKALRTVVTFAHTGDAEVAAHRAEIAAAARTQLKSAVVFLHGLDDKPASWESSVQWLAGKIGPKCRAVCPAAPVLVRAIMS